MRIMIACFGQETNTFSPDRIGIETFLPDGWHRAEDLIGNYEGTASYLGGAIRACRAKGVEMIPLDSTSIDGGPVTTKACMEECLDHLCRQVAAHWKEADGLFLAMHGAGASEGVEDLEGETLERLRKIVGKDFPIMSSLDIHGNITPKMVELSDGLFVIKEFPHTDMAEAAELAVLTLIESISTGKRPVMSWQPLPIILPNTTTTTVAGPMASVRDHFAQVCKERGCIDATMVQGFSANDQYWAGASALVVAWEDATQTARELAKYFWDRRREFDPEQLTAAQAMDRAQAYTGKSYAMIHESTDNPGSGCPGDGTHLLRELVARDLPGSLFMTICDPEVAEQAHQAGIGGKFKAFIGGKTAPICGEPLEAEVEVLGLADGHFRYVTPQNFGAPAYIGPTARLRTGNVEIVVASQRTQAFDDRSLWITGGNIDDYKIVCIKSAGHFRAYFNDRAGCIIPCETPGLRSTNLKTYNYQKLRRPVYPLDETVQYE